MDPSYKFISSLAVLAEFCGDSLAPTIYSSAFHSSRRLFRSLYALTGGVDIATCMIGHCHSAINNLIGDSYSD